MRTATKATKATEGGLWSHKSLLSHSENCTPEGVLDPSAATRRHSEPAIPLLSFSGSDTATKATKATEVSIRSAAGNETWGSDQAEHWVDLFAQRAAKWELGGRPRAEAERVAWAEVQNRWHLRHGERVTRDICAGCRKPIGGGATSDLIDGSHVHVDNENACLIRHGERWRAAATRMLMALGLRPLVALEE
jgi:hypothetical protein